jgi:signal transduction histidine kinase
MDFTSRAISIMISGTITLLMAAFVYWKYRKRKIARIFATTAFFMAGYGWLTAGLASARSQEIALLWLRIFMPFAYWLVAFLFHFSILFSRTDNRWTKSYLKFSYGMVTVLSLIKILNLSNGAEYRPGQGWFPAHDPVYSYVYAPFELLTIVLALLLVVFRMVKTPSGSERNKLWFFFLAIGAALVLDTCILFPAIDFLGAFSTLAFTGILAYAITRHRLFDLSLVISKGPLAAGLSFVMVVGLVAVVFKIQELVVIRELGFGFFSTISTALLVSALFPLFWTQVSKWVNRIFGVRVTSLEQRLLGYTLLWDKHVQLDGYFFALLRKLEEDMGVSRSWILLKDGVRGGFSEAASSPVAASSLSLDSGSLLVRELLRLPRPLDLEELLSAFDEDVTNGLEGQARRALAQEMTQLGLGVALPVLVETRVEAVLLLSGKASDSIYTSRELEFLQALCGQLSAALENNRLHRQVQQADRLSTLGTLSSSLAHELRNPLTSISAFVEMLPSRFADGVFQEKFSRIVGLELDKLIKLTDQLLSFSKPSVGPFEPLSLGTLAQQASQLLGEQFSKKSVALTLEGGQGAVMGKEAELSQVLVNLLLNALQATPATGAGVLLKVWDDEANAYVSVTDQGCGMTPEQLKHIFDPFYTTKKEGTGLGLSTCLRAVEQHSGSLSVTSSLGQGSCFVVRLPKRHQAQILAA